MLLRVLALAATVVLAVPTLAAAQEHDWHHPPPGHPGGPPPHGGPPRGPMAGPHPGGPGPQFGYHGHMFNRVHLAPFMYPHGWGYRRWGIGLVLPPVFLVADYYYTDWATLGLEPPPPGFQWVRYGPDLLLVNVGTGQITDVIYGAFY
jgi:hypothetical protein